MSHYAKSLLIFDSITNYQNMNRSDAIEKKNPKTLDFLIKIGVLHRCRIEVTGWVCGFMGL